MTSHPAQEWNAARYAENARFVAELGHGAMELLHPQAGENILDLGCGDGALTEKIAAAGAHVLAVDGSADMVSAARQRGLAARQADAYQLSFENEFDAVFSNAALHWMKRDPDAVIRGIHSALKPGGRFVAEMGGFGNVAAITVALCAVLQHEQYGVSDVESIIPWYFPTPEEYSARLVRAGFRLKYMSLFPRPTVLPTGMRGWLETFAVPFLKSVPPDQRAQFLDDVTRLLRPALCDEKGNWTADYVRLRFLAWK